VALLSITAEQPPPAMTVAELGAEQDRQAEAARAARSSGAVTAKSLVGGVALNYIGMAIASAIGFFLTPYMIHRLGSTSFGVLMLSTAMLNYATLLDFGIGLSVMKLVADRAHEADRTGIQRLVSTVLVLYGAVGVVIVIVALALYGPISGQFHVPVGQQDAFRWCYVCAALAIGVTFPFSVFTAVITGHRDFALQNRFVVLQSLVSAAGTVVLLELGHGVVAVAVLNLGIAVAQFVIKVLVVHARYAVRFARGRVDRTVLPSVLAFASWVFVINVASKIIFDTDTIVVGALLGPAAVAIYQVALAPNVVLRKFGEQFNVVALTGGSSLHAQGQPDAVRRLFLESTRMTAVIMLPFAIVFGAWGHAFIALWVGPKFHDADSALLYLALAMTAIAIQGTASQIIMAHSRHRVMAIATTCEAIANLALSIVLGKRYGIEGVALGTLLPTLVTAFAVALPYAARLTGSSLFDVAVRLGPPLVGAAALVAGGRALTGWRPFTSMVELAVAAAIVFGGFIVANILIFAPERGTYLTIARGVLARGREATLR
jgi:O-antigen/teichoic acid export membrane protein